MIDQEPADALLREEARSEELAQSAVVERLAVQAAFDPEPLGDDDGRAVLELLCDELPSGEYILRDRVRIEALARMLKRGGRADLARIRHSVDLTSNHALQRMLDAFVLDAGPPLEARDEDDLVASLAVWRWATEAVAMAGKASDVPVEPTRDAIESRLALLGVTRAVRLLARSGLIGREPELARLHHYCRSGSRERSLEAEPAMVVHGIGGAGKSTLVARFVMDLYERPDGDNTPWAYLDLDRPTLASCDADVVLADIARQVAAQRPDERRMLRRAEEVNRRRMKGAGLESFDEVWSYREAASDFCKALRGIGANRLVVVLDTYERLERHRPEKAAELRDLFAVLAAELPGFRLIVSGRLPAPAFVDPSRHDRQILVGDLTHDAAVDLLRHFVSLEANDARRQSTSPPDELARDVIALVGGIPLTLRIAARVLVEEGPEAITDAARRAGTLDRVRTEFIRGFLYQRILNHVTASPPVTTDELRELARASIALRRTTVELVEQVLMPAMSPPAIASSRQLFDALATEVAFMDLADGHLRLREELRGPALAALRMHKPTLVRRVHERAASYYAAAPDDPPNRLELAYHRLASGASMLEFDAELLRELTPTMDELPRSATRQLERAFDDDAALLAARDLERWERRILPKADAALRDGRLEEARQLLAERAGRNRGTELHRLQSRLAEAEGDVDGAAAAAARDFEAATFIADPTRFAAAAIRLAGLHEMRGAAIDADDALRTAGEAALLAGHPDLRLQLQLNRINTRERTAIDDDESRWLHGLAARALMQRTDPSELTSNTALVRLLAAALGSEEPDRIREAARLVGLGHDEDDARVAALIDALSEWDASLDAPGTLAMRAHLRLDGDDPAAIRQAWMTLAGLGTQAGYVLDQLWGQEPPPPRVLESLRAIYLWWGKGTGQPTTTGDAATQTHFLSEFPIDWSRPEMRSLDDLLLTAYPTMSDCLLLASRVGVNPAELSSTRSVQATTRELLEAASHRGLLDVLVDTVLADPHAASIHKPLRALLGDAWLSRHAPE